MDEHEEKNRRGNSMPPRQNYSRFRHKTEVILEKKKKLERQSLTHLGA